VHLRGISSWAPQWRVGGVVSPSMCALIWPS
jgi:hypothetical protein